jgi:hypothetical protein
VNPLTQAAINNLIGSMNNTGPIALLLLAESGAAAAVNSTAMPGPNQFYGACSAIASAVGYSLALYSQTDQNTICNVIGSYMANLRYLANGPIAGVPGSSFFNFTL